MPEPIKELFVATETSVYAVRRQLGKILVTKTYLRAGTESARRIGTSFSSETDFLAITSTLGIFFYPDDFPLEDIPDIFPKLTHHTTRVIALFFDEDPAIECVEANSPNTKDQRWMVYTKAVLQRLKDDPKIRVSRDSEKGFDEEFFA